MNQLSITRSDHVQDKTLDQSVINHPTPTRTNVHTILCAWPFWWWVTSFWWCRVTILDTSILSTQLSSTLPFREISNFSYTKTKRVYQQKKIPVAVRKYNTRTRMNGFV